MTRHSLYEEERFLASARAPSDSFSQGGYASASVGWSLPQAPPTAAAFCYSYRAKKARARINALLVSVLCRYINRACTVCVWLCAGPWARFDEDGLAYKNIRSSYMPRVRRAGPTGVGMLVTHRDENVCKRKALLVFFRFRLGCCCSYRAKSARADKCLSSVVLCRYSINYAA